MIDFYFFHVGNESEQPQMLVNSILKTNVNCKIYQLTDQFTPIVKNIDNCYRYDCENSKNIMKFRMEAYARTNLNKNRFSIFLDTDMLVLKKINLSQQFKNSDVVLCQREINAHHYVNLNYNDMDMKEYNGLTMGEVWPFLGCFIAVKDNINLLKMNEIYNELEDKYKYWYGDQTVLKKFALDHPSLISIVSEKEYSDLPLNSTINPNAKIVHFKGQHKHLMKAVYKFFFESEKFRKIS